MKTENQELEETYFESVVQLCKRFNVSKNTMMRIIKAQGIKSYRFTRTIRYKLKDVIKAVESGG